jgi:leucyl aminopeptidase
VLGSVQLTLKVTAIAPCAIQLNSRSYLPDVIKVCSGHSIEIIDADAKTDCSQRYIC